jgi:hypothetical protein
LARQPPSNNPQLAPLTREERSSSIVVTPLSRYVRQASAKPNDRAGRNESEALQAAANASALRNGEARKGEKRERARERDEDGRSLVTVPAVRPPEPPRKQRLPFWKRIALPRKPTPEPMHAAPVPSPPAAPTDLGPVLRQLDALEAQLRDSQRVTREQLQAFEENLTRMWQLEEQIALTEVRERLALLEASQEEIADGLHAVSRHLSILAVVLGLGLATAAFALGILL